MSRSGYSDDLDPLALGRWRAMVRSATNGKRGQQLLRELAEALDAMPEKKLIAHELQVDGEYCALGVVGAKRGISLTDIDPEDHIQVGRAFDIADCLAREIVYINDECGPYYPREETPEERWRRVRKWVAEQIKDAPPSTTTRLK